MKTREELKVLIDFLRAEGVTSYEENGIRITLTAKPPEADPSTIIRERAAEEKRREPVFAGLTADECQDLFMENK